MNQTDCKHKWRYFRSKNWTVQVCSSCKKQENSYICHIIDCKHTPTPEEKEKVMEWYKNHIAELYGVTPIETDGVCPEAIHLEYDEKRAKAYSQAMINSVNETILKEGDWKLSKEDK